MDTKDGLESVEPNSYAQGYRDGVAAGNAEADKWWARYWSGLRAGLYGLMRTPSINRLLDKKAKEVLSD